MILIIVLANVCRRGYRHVMYVPDIKAMKALREAQNAHQQQIVEIVGPQKAAAIGLAQLSGHKELMRWTFKDKQALEDGLGTKNSTDDGLEWVRKIACPHIRMPDVADYYFKVCGLYVTVINNTGKTI